jgi:hypothetical protein
MQWLNVRAHARPRVGEPRRLTSGSFLRDPAVGFVFALSGTSPRTGRPDGLPSCKVTGLDRM